VCSPALREQDKMIRSLWTLLRRVPGDVVLVDPVTGHEISVERERGFLTLAIADPAEQPGDGQVGRAYAVIESFTKPSRSGQAPCALPWSR
jgi:hypothetical protein